MIHISGYNIEKQIYEGKRILFYRGSRISDGTPVLFKLLCEAYPAPSDIARLKHEYEMNQKLTSPYIVKIHSIEYFEKTPVLIMEDFDGQSLQSLLTLQEKFNLVDFLQIALQLTDALFVLYQNNIIHKDLTPNNIIINPEKNIVKITDFGIATLLSNEQKNILNVQQLEGTLHYISPEQTGRINRPIDYRSDFYSLGVTFYQMLTGILPFQSTDELGLIHCHLAIEPLPPHNLDSKIPLVISHIIMKLMEKSAENRYQSVIGLKADLEKCLYLLQTKGAIEPFKIGQQDYSDRLQIPTKLYGREEEIKLLHCAFGQVCKGKKIVTMITGYSGVGKSKLVNELRNVIAEKQGYFISGKFDQFQHDIPYSALIHAFKQLIEDVLTTNKKQLMDYKTKLLQALGPNGKILVDVLPEMEAIIGEQPGVAELPAADAKNRFHLVFQNFVRVFCTADHPMVIYLDDLHWADLSTLTLLEALMSDFELKYLFLISTYKIHEVHEMHPLMLMLENIKKEKIPVNTIVLNPLNLGQITQLLSETLYSTPQEVQELAELSLEKTAGNAFFLSQFLHSLYQTSLIRFDKELLKWQWDLPSIHNAGITDNVVELIAGRMQKLPQTTQEVLKLAACIGNQFELKTISILQEKSLQESYDDLWLALQEGLISISGGVSAAFQPANPSIIFNFRHDRIHQSAYSLMPIEDTKEIHLNIGRLLLWSLDWQEEDRNLLDIVNQLNRGIELVDYSYEKEEIAKLELLIGRKVKKATAYDAAYKYFKIGIDLLEKDCFTTQYELAYALYIEAAEASYLNGDSLGVKYYTEAILHNSTILFDKIKAYEVQILSYGAQNKLSEAINTGLFALALLNIKIPHNPTKFYVAMEFLKLKFFLFKQALTQPLPQLKELDALTIACTEIISKMAISTYKTSPNLGTLLVLKRIKMGNASRDPLWHVTYGILLCNIGNMAEGYRYGDSALQLLNTGYYKGMEVKTIAFFYTFIHHWKLHLKDSLPKLLNNYLLALETGDVNYATISIFSYSYQSYYAGKELSKLEEEMRSLYHELYKLKNKEYFNSQLIFHQAILNLRGYSPDPCLLCGEMFDETTALTNHFTTLDRISSFDIHLNKLILYYLFGNYDQARESATLTKKYVGNATSTFSLSVFYFYYSLALLADLPTLSFAKQQQLLWKVSANQRNFKKWALHAPMNFLHKYYLVEAEIARFLQKDITAMDYYQKAIELAAENNYIQEEALANELAAIFHLKRKDLKIAKTFMSEAHYCYTLWGATAKVNDLEQKYSHLLSDTSEKTSSTHKVTTYTTTSNSNTSAILDHATILKATQSISGEIILEELLKKLIYILLENAGAQRVVYLSKGDTDYVIQAEGWAADKKILIMGGRTLETTLDLSKKVIYHAEYGKSSIILDNASLSTYGNDPYIAQNHHKSIMCMPIISKGDIIGMLYLENNLIEGAFSLERVEILKMISTQLAISLENANLYTTLETSEEKYRTLVDNISEGVLIIQDRKIKFINKALIRITNYRADEILGQEFTSFIPEKNIEIVNEYYQKRLAGEDVPAEYEMNIIKDQIVQCVVILNANIITYNDRPATLVTLKDITLRKRQEEELKIHRDRLEELVEERTSELKAEIWERKKAQNLLEEMATHDTLTGLSNRILFQAQFKSLLELPAEQRVPLALLFIDLDGFKKINDTFGHDCGDIVLKIVAKRLLSSVRASDTVSRLGGDEFTIIIENPNEVRLTSICQRILDEIAAPIQLGQNEGYVTASIGISICPLDGDHMHELIKKADDAMYLAKKSGKNQFIFSSTEKSPT